MGKTVLTLTVSDSYNRLFQKFGRYFESEMEAIGDNTLGQELDIHQYAQPLLKIYHRAMLYYPVRSEGEAIASPSEFKYRVPVLKRLFYVVGLGYGASNRKYSGFLILQKHLRVYFTADGETESTRPVQPSRHLMHLT